jgi:uncharacterized iron-regulated membrane protein
MRQDIRLIAQLLDFHNISSVVALPFFLTITFTGLAIFFYLYLPWGKSVNIFLWVIMPETKAISIINAARHTTNRPTIIGMPKNHVLGKS